MQNNVNRSKQFFYPVRDANDPYKVSLEPIPEHIYHQIMPDIWKIRKRMHIHDELVIEADPRMSLQAVCEQMGRTPPWAEGLQLRADGYETNFYRKD